MIEVLALAVAAAGVAVAWVQLGRGVGAIDRATAANRLAVEANTRAADANQLSALMALLQVEAEIRRARDLLAVAAGDRKAGKSTDAYLNARIEGYLNALDRFCSCVRYGLFDESVYRREYRVLLHEAIKNNEDFFGAATPYRNITHVHGQWADDKDAHDLALPPLALSAGNKPAPTALAGA